MSPLPGHHLSEPAWRRLKGGAWIVLTIVFVFLLLRAEDKSDEAIDRVTRVESPCLKYGAKSDQCKEAFEQAVLTITHAQACAILRKAGLEIPDCRGARLHQEAERRYDRNAPKYGAPADRPGATESPTVRRGGAGTEVDPVNVPPDPGEVDGGGESNPSSPGNQQGQPKEEPATFPNAPGAPASVPAPSGGEEQRIRPPTPSNPPAAPPPSAPENRPSLLPENLIPSTVEATGKAAGEAVEGVGGVVGETGKAVDCVLRSC